MCCSFYSAGDEKEVNLGLSSFLSGVPCLENFLANTNLEGHSRGVVGGHET